MPGIQSRPLSGNAFRLLLLDGKHSTRWLFSICQPVALTPSSWQLNPLIDHETTFISVRSHDACFIFESC